MFWPSAMPMGEEGELQKQPAIFAAGIVRLMPKVLVVFGQSAMADIGIADRFQPFLQDMVDGKLLVCLPDIQDLLRIPKQRTSAVSLLRAVFMSIGL